MKGHLQFLWVNGKAPYVMSSYPSSLYVVECSPTGNKGLQGSMAIEVPSKPEEQGEAVSFRDSLVDP